MRFYLTYFILAIVILAVLLILTTRTLLHLFRRGDERRQMILGKSCIVSFAGTLVFLLLSMVTSGTVWLHPIVCLIVALLFFTISLAYYNRKLGG